MTGRNLLAAALGVALIGAPTNADSAPPAYPLDAVPRTAVKRGGKLRCPKVPMVRYRGTTVRYHSPTYVYTGFAKRLARFEKVVAAVATEFYGRPPRRIRHMGTFNCRRIGGHPNLISEHGLGNGIDVAGFDFGRAPRAVSRRGKLPAKLKRAFRVRMKTHWGRRRGVDAWHAKFLDTLARRLVARKDIFRVLLGPSYPGHKDHFHFDMAPYRMVQIW